MCIRDVAVMLTAQCTASPLPLTARLEDLTGIPLAVEVDAAGERPLTTPEQHRLAAHGLVTCRWRTGRLLSGRIIAAATTLIWLPARLPADVCAALDAGLEPAGRILGPLGMRRARQMALDATGMEDVLGHQVAVRSSAVLMIDGVPVGIAGEDITREFAEAIAAAAVLPVRARPPGRHRHAPARS